MLSNFPERELYIRTIFTIKMNSLSPKMKRKWNRKFCRDSIDQNLAVNYSSRILSSFKCLSFTTNTVQPSKVHHPIVLAENVEISNDFKELCAKGPSFVPTPSHFDWLQLQKDFDAFRNRLRARFIFKDSAPVNQSHRDSSYPPKKTSKWSAPKTNSPEIETFLSSVERDLFADTSFKNIRNNLTKAQRDSLKSWRKEQLFNKDGKLVLRTQDKGNRFVIVDKLTDKAKAKEQIDRSSFVEIDHDPTQSHIRKVTDWAEKWYAAGEIKKEWRDFVINKDAKPGKNSTLYKTHKVGNPVRLLTSGCNTAIENLARYIESVCAPVTENLPSRIKNTAHLLDIIDELNNNELPEDAILVSFDIINMFPSIDNTNGVNAMRLALDGRTIKSPSTECVIEGLEICLFNNNSVFAEVNLLQTNGTATGAPNSCSYADIAVSPIDDAVFVQMTTNYKELKYFGRYRDDCFALWIGTVRKLNLFFEFMNSLNEDLKFTMEIGRKELCFLDVKISIVGKKLETTVYSKPTDSRASINGIPKGVALRLRRLCSTDEEFDKQATEYKRHLELRGYKSNLVTKAFSVTRSKTRVEARLIKDTNSNSRPVIFSTKYNPRGPNVKSIVDRHLPTLLNVTSLKDVFPEGSVMVANKRENGLADLLQRSDPYSIKSDLTDHQKHGYTKCGRTCDSCNNFVSETKSITSFATGRKFDIRRDSTCSMKNLIYVAICQSCLETTTGKLQITYQETTEDLPNCSTLY